ncbi:antitoxin MazE family protein [Komagataeibacter sp. FNDCF1]|uniref:antitoxin MazE family protein n=1 Tax=Komagataeibacter sp. FNDCF1 TaxID=2878681 RepID=UPI001E3F2F1D|nr:antitoxin MazE family protein [Komagataeibacter sp. FNDCF1]MCE2566430.1 antitoxin MazE family protein [Komagataeibacter sp. FNDCF1]
MTPVAIRVKKRRDTIRKAGLRPVQIWVPDTRAKGFDEECRRQAMLVALADAHEPDIASFLDAAAADLDGWEA